MAQFYVLLFKKTAAYYFVKTLTFWDNLIFFEIIQQTVG